ncbi:MAG: curlin [Salinarimonas sp.]
MRNIKHSSALRAIAAAATAAVLLAAPLATPATASGTLGVTVTPGTPEGDLAVRTGLALFGLAQGASGSAQVGQHGNGNAAGILQGGGGNLGVVHQQGNGHTGTLEQSGGGNAHGLFQFGEGAQGHVQQSGGETGVTVQVGF